MYFCGVLHVGVSLWFGTHGACQHAIDLLQVLAYWQRMSNIWRCGKNEVGSAGGKNVEALRRTSLPPRQCPSCTLSRCQYLPGLGTRQPPLPIFVELFLRLPPNLSCSFRFFSPLLQYNECSQLTMRIDSSYPHSRPRRLRPPLLVVFVISVYVSSSISASGTSSSSLSHYSKPSMSSTSISLMKSKVCRPYGRRTDSARLVKGK